MQDRNKMPITAIPYQHQIRAYHFVCKLFGLEEGGDDYISIKRGTPDGAALLMEM